MIAVPIPYLPQSARSRAMPKKKATPLAQQVATKKRPVEWIAERLTGKRAQAGRLPGGGAPRYSYEVKWKNTGETAETAWPNTFEVTDNLGGWEKEMKEVDERIAARANEPSINPVQQATAARELAAQRKGEKLAAHRERLLRKKRREEARGGSDSSPPDSEAEHDDELPDGEQLEAELAGCRQSYVNFRVAAQSRTCLKMLKMLNKRNYLLVPQRSTNA